MPDDITRSLTDRLDMFQSNLVEIEQQIRDVSRERTLESLLTLRSLYEEKDKIETELGNIRTKINKLRALRKPRTIFRIKVDGKVRDLSIVSPELSDLKRGFISHESPLARALLNFRTKKNVLYTTPLGQKQAEILNVLNIA
jgi:transcription elongation GreA/GreB family factor